MMDFIKEIFLQNAISSLKAAIVIILLMVLTKPITKRYTAGFRYYSWLAVMLIFLIPFARLGVDYTVKMSPAVTEGVHSVRDWYEEKAPEYSVTEEYVEYERQTEAVGEKPEKVRVVKTTTQQKRVDVMAIAALIWLIGALGYLFLHYGRYVYFRRGLKRLGNAVNDERILGCLKTEEERLKISKPVKISHSQLIDTPMLVGLLKPRIILPRIDYTDDELCLILRHELFHFKRKDILYQLVTLIFVSLHWFNLIVHLMARAIEIDGETSCDEKTLEGREYEERIFYGEMLIKFLRTETQKRSYMTTTFFGGKNGMKKRLTLIADKKTRRKGAAAMAVVMITAIITSIGAAAMDNEYFNSVFEGDTSYLADFIKTEKKSVEDDRFKLTLEQYLVAENQAMIIYSFEAKTPDAVEELNSDWFWDMDTIMFGPTDYNKASCQGHGGYGSGELTEKYNTENKIYSVLVSDTIENEEKIDFYLTTDKIEGSPKIIIPMDYNMETKTAECGDVTVKYNPISITVTMPAADIKEDCEFCYYRRNDLYFRMKNGEIKTYTQLYDHSGGYTDVDENHNTTSYTSRGWARAIIEPDEIKSVIVDDTEYPVDNPSKPKPVIIDGHMKPFIIDAYVQDHLWIPLRAFCEGLGAEIEWDNDTKTASFNYRGSSYSFTVGKLGIVIDGEECDFGDEAPFIDEQGRMIVPPHFNGYMNHTYIAVDTHGYEMTVGYDENGGGILNPNAKWHIVP